MIEARRRAYLRAMGYDIWLARAGAPEGPRVRLGPGAGSTLLVCTEAADCATLLAADLVRALGGAAVWAWLDSEAGVSLQGAVDEGLFTRVILFGKAGDLLFGDAAPGVLGSAALIEAPSLTDLAASGRARQAFWQNAADAGSPAREDRA